MSVEVTTTGGTTVSASTGSGTSVSLTASSTSVSVASPATNSVSITSKGPKGDTGATGPVGPEISGGPYLPLSAGSGFPLTGELDMSSNKITDVLAGSNSLDAVNYQQLTNAITGVLTYKGIWNANTNDPTLVSEEGTLGGYYIVSVAGITTLDGISDWAVGDWAVFSDQPTDAWQKIDNTSILGGAGTGGKISVWTGSGTSSTLGDSVITELSGNIGIGTASPDRELEVQGTGNVYIKVAASTDDDSSAIELENTQNTWTIKNDDTSDDALKFQSAGGTKATILKTGNVGIGTTSPDAKLHVYHTGNGEAIIERASGAKILLQAQAAAGVIGTSSNHDLDIKTNGDTRVKVETSGNVGIGTTSPGELLEVDGNIRLGDGGQRNLIGPTNENLGIFANPNGTDEGILFSTDNGTTTELIILNGGNVGIGTTSPSARLEVSGSATTSVDLAHFSNSNGVTKITNSLDGAGAGQVSIFDGSNNEDVRLSAHSNSWINSGNVGIGTASPAADLDVVGTARMDTGVTEGIHYVGTALEHWGDGGTGMSFPANDVITLKTSGSERLRIDASGNVGIGTASPAAKLDVNGGIRMANDTAAASATNVGTQRYRATANNSYVEMCMQTAASGYSWVIIKENSW